MKRLFGFSLALGAAIGWLCSATQTQGQQKPADKHHNGHELMAHPSTLKNGVHHFHTTPSGHRLHAKVHDGKIHDLHVIGPNGKQVAVSRVKKRVASAGGDGAIRTAAQTVVIMVGFTYFDAWQGCNVTIWFPSAWVA
jgi:hypothetical protein